MAKDQRCTSAIRRRKGSRRPKRNRGVRVASRLGSLGKRYSTTHCGLDRIPCQYPTGSYSMRQKAITMTEEHDRN